MDVSKKLAKIQIYRKDAVTQRNSIKRENRVTKKDLVTEYKISQGATGLTSNSPY